MGCLHGQVAAGQLFPGTLPSPLAVAWPGQASGEKEL